ncbi:class I SAM-dependent methyltransferase [Pseudoduganella violacea]|uniref:SAM-dependent methyltransferase n=1 Tax=Pseudoduganella violacea TaxID=1715466 RepID=A0A7W5B830_9BURK|nr:class I SAM-dependent methyltransferase [Pseudoduganella violacea]MBB3118151.1 SAM-dependent methyltransferase [Pseudoduganella violacea]
MTQIHQANQDQVQLWNGHTGHAWVDMQGVLDQLFTPMERRLMQEAAALRPSTVLDVGCGTGAVTLALARGLGGQAQCTGADISQPMIEAAQARAARAETPASFVLADAQTHDFGQARFDLIVSRLGVMFFDDPVRAFGNLRQAAVKGAALRFIAWRGPEENPFMTAGERAVAHLLPALAPRPADRPGQFGLASRERIISLLQQSGWQDVEVAPLDLACAIPEADLVPYLSMLGPVGPILPNESEARRREIVGLMRAACEPYVHGGEVRINAACWLASARNPGA